MLLRVNMRRQWGWIVLGVVLSLLFWISPLNPFPNKLFWTSGSARTVTVKELFAETRPATLRIEQQSNPFHIGPDSIGTGFIISPDGYVLTAYHVIYQAERLTALLPNRHRYSLQVVGFDSAQDLALLKIVSNETFSYLPLASRDPEIKTYVMAIGNSKGEFLQPRAGQLLRQGVRSDRADFPQGTLELSAPIGPGDSGGPILNGNGEAVGVVSYIRVDDQGQWISGYAVPIREDSQLLRDLKKGVQRDVPVIGFQVVGAAEAIESQPAGVVVGAVAKGGPAEQAGIQPDDLITAVNGEPTPTYNDLVRIVRMGRVGESVSVAVQREGRSMEVRVVLQAKAKVFSR